MVKGRQYIVATVSGGAHSGHRLQSAFERTRNNAAKLRAVTSVSRGYLKPLRTGGHGQLPKVRGPVSSSRLRA